MLEVLGLFKRYGDIVAVNNVSFSLQPGDVFGFIGSNGAGKTTTIRMLATLLRPGKGTATVNGVDILKNPMEVRRQIGYMPDFFGLYDDVRVWEYLDFFANIYEVPVRERNKVIDGVLELTGLEIKKDAFVQTLSRGMQQRLCLAKCLVHDPALLLLDEPASGLDPRARADLRDLINRLGQMGKMVIVSSHILPELAGFCNTVGIIESGNLVACGPIETVTKGVDLATVLTIRVLTAPEDARAFLAAQPHVEKVELAPEGQILVQYRGNPEAQADLLQGLIEQRIRVRSFQEESADLEDVFLKLTKGTVN